MSTGAAAGANAQPALGTQDNMDDDDEVRWRDTNEEDGDEDRVGPICAFTNGARRAAAAREAAAEEAQRAFEPHIAEVERVAQAEAAAQEQASEQMKEEHRLRRAREAAAGTPPVPEPAAKAAPAKAAASKATPIKSSEAQERHSTRRVILHVFPPSLQLRRPSLRLPSLQLRRRLLLRGRTLLGLRIPIHRLSLGL